MATITISILESPLQIVAGIPSNVTLETNIPSTVFYTLDGTDPTSNSLVAIDYINLPTNSSKVILKVFATNGIDSSAIVTQEYVVTSGIGARNPHDSVQMQQNFGATYPLGSQCCIDDCVTFGNTTGVIIDNQDNPTRVPDGYDGTATGTGSQYYIPPKSKYEILFSETDSIGQRGKGIGTLPGRVLWVKPTNNNVPKQSSDAQKALFDPKALVIFQDSSEEPYDPSVPRINRPRFDLEDPTKTRDGSLLSAVDAITTSGSFVKAHYNPTNNMITYYYYDNRVSRWIISKEPYNYTQNPTSNLSGFVTRSSRNQGVGMVFKWIPFKTHRLI